MTDIEFLYTEWYEKEIYTFNGRTQRMIFTLNKLTVI